MQNRYKIIFSCVALTLLWICCRKEYSPSTEAKQIRMLVVEGFLNSGLGPTTIKLSRTTDLTDTTRIKAEQGAQVNVEGENGTNFTMTGNSLGEYTHPQLTLANNVKYRLRIRTKDGKEYVSAYTPVRPTPPIDSISWQRENEGVRLYVHAHDPRNATIYYNWEYEETWEYKSAFQSSVKYVRDNVTGKIVRVDFKYPDHSFDTTIFKCWKTLNSTSILLGSSEKLTADVIYLPIHYIEPRSEKLSVLYSINLKQYALTQEKYLFLQKMKKNTEQLGSLFDPQPSQLSGNIHCTTDPNEVVIGFVEVTQQQVKRIFIYNSEVSSWRFQYNCQQIELDNQPDTLFKYGEALTPTTYSDLTPRGDIAKFFATNDWTCVDCRYGRTNKKPAFWP